MIIVYGTRLFGRADAIEGLGHVACRFVHIMFVPLIPIETVFMVDEDRGVKLPFSFKAAMSGWLRGGALMSGIGMLIGGIVNFAEGEPLLGAVLVGAAALCFAAFPLVGLLFGRCSDARRAEIQTMLGVRPTPGTSQGAPMPMNFGAAAAQGPHAGPPPPAGGFGHAPAYGQNYGAPPQQPAYGAPPQNYGAPPPQGYGAPPPNYGAPPPNYGAPPSPQMGYGAPAPAPAHAAPPAYGAAPQAPPGYGPPGYGPPPGYDPNRR